MIRASTLIFLSGIVLLLAGASIAALGDDRSDSGSRARLAPDIVATQTEPIVIEVELPSEARPATFTEDMTAADDLSVHPDSGLRVLSARAQSGNRLLLSLDVSRAKAGKWTLDFGARAPGCTATLTVHQAPGTRT